MAQSQFLTCLHLTLTFEGGFTQNRFDPGGATNKGITLRTFSFFKKRPVSRVELIAISQSDVESIYKEIFWNPIRGDELPAGVDAVLFDYAVNSGPQHAIRALQYCLNIKSTGRFDDALLHLIHQTQPVQLIASLSLQRKGFMERLRQFTIFKKGWLSRVNHVESVARTMSL